VLARSATSTVPTAAAAPSIATTKTGHIATGTGTGTGGSVIGYDFVITNAGNVTLSLVSLVDALAGVSKPVITFPGTTGLLAPRSECRGDRKLHDHPADADFGTVAKVATSSGRAPDGTIVAGTSPTSNVATALRAPAISTTQSATLRAGATGAVGDAVDYSYMVTNSGNTTLTATTPANTVTGLSAPVITWPTPRSPGTLAPGQTVTATATSPITQATVDAGSASNTATVRGTTPGSAVSSGTSGVVTVTTATRTSPSRSARFSPPGRPDGSAISSTLASA
jgi:hypothetical protein